MGTNYDHTRCHLCRGESLEQSVETLHVNTPAEETPEQKEARIAKVLNVGPKGSLCAPPGYRQGTPELDALARNGRERRMIIEAEERLMH